MTRAQVDTLSALLTEASLNRGYETKAILEYIDEGQPVLGGGFAVKIELVSSVPLVPTELAADER